MSGGNDCHLFVWELAPGGSGQQFTHSDKVNALAGHDLSKVYLADNSDKIRVSLFQCTCEMKSPFKLNVDGVSKGQYSRAW